MLIVAVATAVAASEGGGDVDVLELALVTGMAVAFVAFFALGGTSLMRRFPGILKAPRFSESPAVVTALAVVTKLAGAWLGALGLGRPEALFVGWGMVPRGEVGIVVASIGAAAGVLDDRAFAVIVAMSVATTLGVPPILRRLAVRLPQAS